MPNQKPLRGTTHSMFHRRWCLTIKLEYEILMIFKISKTFTGVTDQKYNLRSLKLFRQGNILRFPKFSSFLSSSPRYSCLVLYSTKKKQSLSKFSINESLKWEWCIQEDSIWCLLSKETSTPLENIHWYLQIVIWRFLFMIAFLQTIDNNLILDGSLRGWNLSLEITLNSPILCIHVLNLLQS